MREDAGMPSERIFGIDFTSAPGLYKPLTCASAVLDAGSLHVQAITTWTNFGELDAFLDSPGPWVCGLDFPFALPKIFLEEVGWPSGWEAATLRLEEFFRGADRRTAHARFREIIKKYRDRQPAGKKHPRRRCDELAEAVSPLMVFGVPVGLMLLEGGPRLLASNASVVPVRVRVDDRLVVEAYPGVAARTLLGGRSTYKNEGRDAPKRKQVRWELLQALVGPAGHAHYGFDVTLEDGVRAACLADFRGDTLDAVLCSVQAAWATLQLAVGWRLPVGANPNEGWIFDPALG